MSDHEKEINLVSTGLKHFRMDSEDDNAQGSSTDQSIIEGTPKPIQSFCKQICAALHENKLGYADTDDLAIVVFETTGIDPHRLPQTFGYDSFADFLRSKHMKPYVDIDDSDGIATYHYPMSLIRKDASKDTDAEQEGFLEVLNNRRRKSLGLRMDRECPNASALLYERHCKRMGKPPPPSAGHPNPMIPPSAGRGRRNYEEMRNREFEAFLSRHPELRNLPK